MKRGRRVQIDKGAWIYRRGDKPVWYLDLNVPGQPRRRFSLDTAHKDVALARARQEVEDAQANGWGISLLHDVPLDEFIRTYEEHAKIRNTAETIDLNVSNIRRFRDFMVGTMKRNREPLVSEITPSLIESYIAMRKAPQPRPAGKDGTPREPKVLSPTTINRELGTLSVFLSFARERRHIRHNPVERVQPLPAPKRIPRTLTTEQVQKLLGAAKEPVPFHGRGCKGQGNDRQRLTPLHDMIFFGVNTGARLGEMLFMEWGDVDLEGGFVFFRNKPDHRIKDHADRQVKMNEAVLKMLTQRKLAAGKCRWVFPSATGDVIGRANALREFYGAAHRAKVEGANWQILRRTFLTHCAKAGTPPFILKELAGHSSIRTTETFYIGAGGGKDWVPPVIGA